MASRRLRLTDLIRLDVPKLSLILGRPKKQIGYESNYLVDKEIKEKDPNARVCFLTASELYYKEFRKKEYRTLDKELFIRKPIENDELIKEIKRLIRN